jgi:hypothetical protein
MPFNEEEDKLILKHYFSKLPITKREWETVVNDISQDIGRKLPRQTITKRLNKIKHKRKREEILDVTREYDKIRKLSNEVISLKNDKMQLQGDTSEIPAECPVCLSQIRFGVMLPCTHYLCQACFNKILLSNSQNACSICRAYLTTNSQIEPLGCYPSEEKIKILREAFKS